MFGPTAPTSYELRAGFTSTNHELRLSPLPFQLRAPFRGRSGLIPRQACPEPGRGAPDRLSPQHRQRSALSAVAYAISIWPAGMSMRAPRAVSTSIPSNPSIGPLNGKSCAITPAPSMRCPNIVKASTRTRGAISTPPAVVMRMWSRLMAGLQPTASRTSVGITVWFDPVSTSRIRSRAPRGPVTMAPHNSRLP